mmetsp:Transcript_22611/g.27289  ORF Transcript_22611/g.27289 Transcript_22611/m.27289 type:complete len:751 (+) Transcript_22611:306-2558(+)|eukprot:CAMPEP_0197850272 /NCGR_PEP_ID=MMETSP1438-20131217/14840_1 /TAXON_ID=1461541 /ORGANISM="Pterosperma sp., Strain CCMP1384" /LENGTH=750 /DNA_ID=CAMNT_0043463349 /DNA_START=306 /DNA_END=2558 /DNA_ORIENTATION=-
MDFPEIEAKEGVRMTWNVWPNNRAEASKCVVPLGAFVTPAKVLPDMPVNPYEPVRCRSCSAILNPFARVDFNGKIWICPFCYQRNHFPPHYASIAENNLPAELFPNYTAIEYQLPPQQSPLPPTYLLVVDTVVSEEELTGIKASLTQALSLLPENANVGLITYGTHVHVHELSFQDCSKSYVFRGTKEVTMQQVADQLKLRGQGGTPAAAAQSGVNRFLCPLSECEFQLTNILDELQRDAFPTLTEQRSARCTGAALQVAIGLLGAGAPGAAARCLLFVGGPTTEGPGTIVGKSHEEAVRQHKDIAKEAAPYYKKAKKFYADLSSELVRNGHVVDIFACALDQVGLAEMKVCVKDTGGCAVLAESFVHPVFKQSFQRLISKNNEEALGLAARGTFETFCSRDVKIAGVIGPCAPLDKPGPQVSEVPIGAGGTTAWRLCGLDAGTTLCVFMDVAETNKDPQQATAQQQFFVQFVCTRTLPNGENRMRVVTITRAWTDGANTGHLIAGFDQEAAAVMIARLAAHKMETDDEFDAMRWLDRKLINFAKRFGDYRKDDPQSFQLQQTMSIFPQFCFNLRRSQFVQVFNNSPDETAHARMTLEREQVANSLLMIQPMLMSYSFNGPPEPVLLDVASIAADRILLLDSFFTVVIFHGVTVAQWRKAEYHKQPEHAAFAQLLAGPQAEVEDIIKSRFPVPRVVDCDQHGSQARFLLTKLNPSATYNSAAPAGSDVIYTDDVSLSVFMEHLRKLSVQE